MNSYERFKSDIQNGVIKAIELIEKPDYNIHALIFKCPQSVIGCDDENYYLSYYSKDLNKFMTDSVPFPCEDFYKENGYEFNYDGEYLEYQKEDYIKYKVHKNRTFFIMGGIDNVQ